MAPTNTPLYPRSTLRRIVKDQTGHKASKDMDVLLYLDYCLFIEDLLKEAAIRARKTGESKITARHIDRVKDHTIRKFKG